MKLGFVLLSEPVIPDGVDVLRAGSARWPDAPFFSSVDEEAGPQGVVGLSGEAGSAHIALIPAPVPNGEAEENAAWTIARYRDGVDGFAEHVAHLMVVVHPEGEWVPLDETRLLIRLVASVVEASPAVAVYLGDGGVTHPADFFLDAARDGDDSPLLWSGVSVAKDGERVSLLSLGLRQFGLPELVLTAPSDDVADAFDYFFKSIGYVASRGAPLGEGETLGRSADERLAVRYAKSPLDEHERVWCIDMAVPRRRGFLHRRRGH